MELDRASSEKEQNRGVQQIAGRSSSTNCTAKRCSRWKKWPPLPAWKETRPQLWCKTMAVFAWRAEIWINKDHAD